MDTNLILTTKLYPPPVTPELVPRKRLLDRLNRNAHRPLTLISAPAGYGKSVLASMWLQNSRRLYGWVSLDEHDNDLPTFMAYLLAAVEAAVPEILLRESKALLELPTLPPVQILATYLLNELTQIEESFFLALDDLHVIRESNIFALLVKLLEHPSSNFHLLLITRHDPPLPIGSLRAYRQMIEIRMRDLRFSTTETAQYLQRILGHDISGSVAAEWNERTEGWIVALRLAALSLRSHPKTTNLPEIVPGENQYLKEYLLAEILAHLPKAKQACLIRTSLLDRFCAPLCQVFCEETKEEEGATALTGEVFIQWLRESNLFLVALDDKNEWFRFHHLFQSDLRNMLERQSSPEEIATLHLRASKWFFTNGLTYEAIQHALTARNHAVAIDYLKLSRYQIQNHEHWNELEQILKLFPEDLVTSDPVLSIVKAYTTFLRSRIHEVTSYLEAAKKLAAALPPDSSIRQSISGEITTLAGALTIAYGQADKKIIENVKSALEKLPSEALFVRALAIGTQVTGYQVCGNWRQGLLIGREVLSSPSTPLMIKIPTLSYLRLACFMEGALDIIVLATPQSPQLNEEDQFWYEKGVNAYFLGIAYYLRNDLAAAEKHFLGMVKKTKTNPAYRLFTAIALARIYQSQQRFDEAAQFLQEANTYLENIGDMVLLEISRAFQIELALDQNDLAAAEQLSQTVDFDRRPMMWFHYIPQLTPIKLLLRQGGQKNLEKAKTQLATREDHLRSINRKTILIDVLALQALVNYAQGNAETAREKLQESLRLAKPGGFIRNYVDLGPATADLLAQLHEQGDTGMDAYISRILAAFQVRERDTPAPELKYPLTKRELQILGLLATDLSPHEIASEVRISVHTTRTHIRNIYRKLDVQSRYGAVEMARNLDQL